MEHTPVPKRDMALDGAEDDPGGDTTASLRLRSRELVPLAPQDGSYVARHALSHPDPSFVTHLIATAAHIPQTRTLCRASPQDAQASYRSVANQNKQPTRPPGPPRVA